MCGLVGFLDRAGLVADASSTLGAMCDTIVHRGPDDSGQWWENARRVGFGFRRLSIQDLSPLGHQPMRSASGRFTIAFNGEVYNFLDLRRELERLGHAFRGGSDTEVMLAAFEEWGVRAALDSFVGMFAFAVWDARERELVLARDRAGVKPLYYGVAKRGGGVPRLFTDGFTLAEDESLVFASELKPFRRFPAMDFSVDRGALTLYTRYAYVPAPWSIHRDIRKLPPGHLLRFRVDDGRATLEQYWSAKAAAEEGARNPYLGDDRSAIDALEKAIEDSVRIRMIADVPLGAFLSGGIDSSVIVAAMTSVSSTVKTYTIGVHDPQYNEAEHAKAIAKHLGTDHTEHYVEPDEALAVIPKLPSIWDEPFADSSQIPTYLVSHAARQHVTVILSGDGGDELFGGYYRYRWARQVWQRIRRLPGPMRSAIAALLRAVPADLTNRACRPFMRFLPQSLAMNTPGDRAHKLASLMGARNRWEMYTTLTSIVTAPSTLVRGGHEPASPLTDPAWLANLDDYEARMMQADVVSYLVDDILVKVDRASMAVSLEARDPYLDHRLIELAFRLPTHLKVRNGTTKWALRQVLYRKVPKELMDRPKMGFSIPLERWLIGPLRDWAENLLDERKLAEDGFFDPAAVRAMWQAQLGGTRRLQHQLWVVLMFQAWRERWTGVSGGA